MFQEDHIMLHDGNLMEHNRNFVEHDVNFLEHDWNFLEQNGNYMEHDGNFMKQPFRRDQPLWLPLVRRTKFIRIIRTLSLTFLMKNIARSQLVAIGSLFLLEYLFHLSLIIYLNSESSILVELVPNLATRAWGGTVVYSKGSRLNFKGVSFNPVSLTWLV